MREEKITHNEIDVYLDSGTREWKSPFKAPYYRMRGKRISEEQAFEVIRRCDDIFGRIEEKGIKNAPDYLPAQMPVVNFKMSKFIGDYGWVHPNGIVGMNDSVGGYYSPSWNETRKEPDTEMLIEEWTMYAKCFPFLDLVVAITGWDQKCPKRQEEHDKILADYNDGKITLEECWAAEHESTFIDYERNGFEDAIQIGVWVHDGTVEILNAGRACEKYLEYERLYEEPYTRIYMPEYYKRFQPDFCGDDYLYKCLRAYGIADPVTFLLEMIRS